MARNEVTPAHLPEASLSVHGERLREQLLKATGAAMVPGSHGAHDARKLLEVLLLRGEQRLLLEEGNHPPEQILATSYHEDQRAILLPIGLDVAAPPEPRLDQRQYLGPVAVLA